MNKLALSTLVLAACIASSALGAPHGEKVDCAQFEAVLDDSGSAQAVTLIADKYKPPTTREQMSKFCANSTEAIKTLRRYNKDCNTALTQQVFSAILRTRASLMDEVCSQPEGDKYKLVFAAIKCIAENPQDGIKAAERETVVMSQVLFDANLADEKERIKRACCAVLAQKRAFLDAARDKCAQYEKVYAEYVDSYTSESLALICPDAEKMAKEGECARLAPLKAAESVKARYVSFLNPMLKIVRSLDH